MALLCRLGLCRHPKFTFRAAQPVGAGMSSIGWDGILVSDRQPPNATLAQIGGATRRYREANPGLPHDGQRFELVDGELRRL